MIWQLCIGLPFFEIADWSIAVWRMTMRRAKSLPYSMQSPFGFIENLSVGFNQFELQLYNINNDGNLSKWHGTRRMRCSVFCAMARCPMPDARCTGHCVLVVCVYVRRVRYWAFGAPSAVPPSMRLHHPFRCCC